MKKLVAVLFLSLAIAGCSPAQNKVVEPRGTETITLRVHSEGVSGTAKYSYSALGEMTEKFGFSEVADDTIAMNPGDTASVTLTPTALDKSSKIHEISCKIVKVTWPNVEEENTSVDRIEMAYGISRMKSDGGMPITCSWKYAK